MSVNKLGRLEKVELRQVWEHEAKDFTPWLAKEDNLKLLGEALGLELELEAQEKDVGPFKADILCKDTITNQWVLIENQLDYTNHSHLGQLLTYAAGVDAVTVVWIAGRFTNEHRAALDWLNEISRESANFFGLEIEVWQIGDSAYAPKFNLISSPNDWSRTISEIAKSIGAGLTNTQQFQLEFWTGFRDYLERMGSLVKPPNPAGRHWMSFAAGRSNFYFLTFINTKENLIGVGLVLQGDEAKPHFYLLQNNKGEIEKVIGEAIEWRELLDNKESQLMLVRYDTDPTDEKKWDEYYSWMGEKIDVFHSTFRPLIQELNAGDYVGETE